MTLQVTLVQRGICDKCGFVQEVAPVHGLIDVDLTCPSCERDWTEALKNLEDSLHVGN